MGGVYYQYEPRPSSYPLLGPKYPLLGTIYPQLRVQGRSWKVLGVFVQKCTYGTLKIYGAHKGKRDHRASLFRIMSDLGFRVSISIQLTSKLSKPKNESLTST